MEKNTNERQERLKKLSLLRAKRIDPYPASTSRDYLIGKVISDFESLVDAKEITIAGRLRNLRSHGNLYFVDLHDDTGKIQLALSKKTVGAEDFKTFADLIDVGDFIEANGTCFVTHRGEKSLNVKTWKILAKAIKPLPEKWHGLQDEEEKLRKRYLDILFNQEVKEMFIKRAKFWQAIREFLIEQGFLEVETPILENSTGGADAKPFITHHNALNLDVFLRISMGELWQKRLMVAGFEKTFEIGRQFRNEGMDSEHLQDYTQMEFYWAYADYRSGMKLVQDLFKHVAQETFGTMQFNIGKFQVDLDQDWKEYDYCATIKQYTGADILSADLSTIEAKLRDLKIEYDSKGFNLTRGIDNLWKYCRKQLSGPGFLINEPLAVSPLAKKLTTNQSLTQRFHVIIAGSELGNGYSELNDPEDQANRFQQQAELREAGDEEAQMNDRDFVEALEYGMPPVCGFGMSERVFAFLMNKNIRECQIFPLMKPKN